MIQPFKGEKTKKLQALLERLNFFSYIISVLSRFLSRLCHSLVSQVLTVKIKPL